MKFKQIAVIIVFALLLMSVGCSKKSEAEVSEVKTSYMMGTVITVSVYGPHRVEVAEKVLDRFKQLENLLSLNIPTSEVCQINKNAGVKPVKVSEDTFEVIRLSLEYADLTDGLFDPTIGPLVQLWGIGTSKARVPSKEEIQKALTLINYHNVVLDAKARTVYLKEKGMVMDTGGITKGYSADQAMKIFKADKTVKSAFVNLGGNVMVYGKKPDKSLWTVGIQDPRAERDELMAAVTVESQAVVSSGDYERYFMKDGVRYHHILNPKTGYPAESDLISTTIIGDNSTDGDGLSTSVFLLGVDKGIALAKSKGFDVMVITKEKKVYMSESLKGKMTITNDNYKFAGYR